jgi:SAM-dependent methyltransferase
MGEPRYNDYDHFAREYARDNEAGPFNALYERPAIVALAGQVRGRRVLDAGCGAGAHAAELIARGAAVTGVDLSAGLLGIARERLGPDVPLHRADLSEPLPLPAGGFDLVLCSLVMHYLAEWEPTLREFHRVLAPGGRVVLSTHYPVAVMRLTEREDYLATFTYTEDWVRADHTMRMRFWHRPLRAMLAAFAAAGDGRHRAGRLPDPHQPRPVPAVLAGRALTRLRRCAPGPGHR